MQRFLAGAFCAGKIMIFAAKPFVQGGMHGRQTGECGTVVGVQFDGMLEHFGAALQIRLGEAGKILAAAEIVFVGGSSGVRAQQGLFFAAAQIAAAQGSGDGCSDFVLDGEEVIERAVEALGPAVIASFGFDELDSDAQTVIGFAHAAFKECADAKLAANLANVRARSAKLEGSGTGSHAQAVHVSESVYQLFGKAFAKIVLIAIGTHVRKRKNRDGGDVGRGVRRRRHGA